MAAKRSTIAARKDHDEQTRLRIYNVLKAAADDGEKHNIELTKRGKSSLDIVARPKEHVVRVRLDWKQVGTAHYTGYFIAADDTRSQAIIALYNQFDAAQFIVALTLLGEIAARVPREPRPRNRKRASR
jgi:hypothetical protein